MIFLCGISALAESPFRMNEAPNARPLAWSVALAFGLVYLSWGTTYYAIRAGVYYCKLPPALFGGVRVGLAGVLLLGYLRWRGEGLRLPAREFAWVAAAGLLIFVGGNGLITFALGDVPSSLAAVLVAATPLWMAICEWFWPRGERLSAIGWLGLFVGLGGVLLLMVPDLRATPSVRQLSGLFLVLGSSACWSLGSILLRHRRPSGSHLAAAAYEMILGGGGLALIGLAVGEAAQLTRDKLTTAAVGSFVYLLVVGSLIGFVAFNWLLGHVPTPLVGTYAYVNPVIAVIIGTVIGDEPLTGWLVGGLIVILAGVALVRAGGIRRSSGGREVSEVKWPSAAEAPLPTDATDFRR
jgi:drug/metabolite transporter (DMT)-like permease